MTPTQLARHWDVVAAFLRGELDHGDEATRAGIARACYRIDYDVHREAASTVAQWDAHLCRVSTEEP